MTHSLPAGILLQLTLLLAACGTLAIVPPGGTSLDEFPVDTVVIMTHGRSYPFTVWVADTAARRSRGLTSVRRLEADHGMLFLFDRPTRPAMWMKNMTIPLDLLFVAADGTLLAMACNIPPDSPRTIEPDDTVTGVIELPAGTASRLHLETGSLIRHPHFAGSTVEPLLPPPHTPPLRTARN